MKIKDIMTDDVQYANPGTSLTQVAKLMKEFDCGSIPVVENDKLVGMVTDRDIVLRCVAEDKEALLTMAEQCMSSGILYCYQDDSVEDVLDNMGDEAVRRLPVVDKNKRLVGIVSLGDLASACRDKRAPGAALDKISEAAPDEQDSSGIV